jgi:hypothetical protein
MVSQGQGYLAMERTVRPIQLVVPATHSVGQDAERRKLRRKVDSVGQTGQLVVARCLGSHGRDFRAQSARTLAAALMMVVGMELVASAVDASHMDFQIHRDQFHHHWERRERGSSTDHGLMIGEDHQQEYGWESQRHVIHVAVG